MIIVDIQQGTPEWFEARRGIPSASNFDKIVTSTGAPSKQRTKYMRLLAAERVTGKIIETYSNATMETAAEVEAEARHLYEMLHNLTIQQVGTCYPDKKKLCAASPDGLVGSDGTIEIKCPLSYTHIEYMLDGGLPTDYFQQVQGQLFVTGRKWTDFMSYYPGLKPFIIRIERDEKFLKALAIELEVFEKQLADIVNQIK